MYIIGVNNIHQKDGKHITITFFQKLNKDFIRKIGKSHLFSSQANPKGGIVHKEAPIDCSNVMYVHKGKVTRIGFTTVEGKNGPKKVRVAKATGDVID